MKAPIKPLTLEEEILITQAWEQNGFTFLGNGGEKNEDDPMYCPYCGYDRQFWALWTKGDLTNVCLLCDDCGARWVDEEDAEPSTFE